MIFSRVVDGGSGEGRQYFPVRMPAEGANMEPISELCASPSKEPNLSQTRDSHGKGAEGHNHPADFETS